MNPSADVPADVIVRPKPRTVEKHRLLPPFHVVLLNDDDHSFDFVVTVIRKVFGIAIERAYQLTMEAHTRGRCIVWTGSKEVAELKAEQLSTFHEVRQRDGAKLGPIGYSLEPSVG